MDPISQNYLDQYGSLLSPDMRTQSRKTDAYHFCADEKNADLCAQLVLKGEKRATASLLWAYADEDEPLPEIGQLTVISNWAKIPQCVVETTSVVIRPFNEVDAEFAYEEGEGDKSIAYWRSVHWASFSNECQRLGRQPDEQMPVVLERFKVVFKDKTAQ